MSLLQSSLSHGTTFMVNGYPAMCLLKSGMPFTI